MRSPVVSQFCVFLFLVFILVSCNKTGNHSHDAVQDSDLNAEAETEEKIAPPVYSVSASFQEQLTSVFQSYIGLKEALVIADPSKVKEEADRMLQKLSSVNHDLLTGAAQHEWMKYHGGLQGSLMSVKMSNDINVQRRSFSAVTEHLYKSVKAYGLKGDTAYYEFCPMAFNDEGGFWLSDNSDIRNPYFGAAMLTCGEVRETLR